MRSRYDPETAFTDDITSIELMLIAATMYQNNRGDGFMVNPLLSMWDKANSIFTPAAELHFPYIDTDTIRASVYSASTAPSPLAVEEAVFRKKRIVLDSGRTIDVVVPRRLPESIMNMVRGVRA